MKFCARAFVASFLFLCLLLTNSFWFIFTFKLKYKDDSDLLDSNLFLPDNGTNDQNVLYFPTSVKLFEKKCNSSTGFKIILFYNEPDFMRIRVRKDAIYKDCECKNCIISHNKSKLLTADAVIFHVGIRNERMGKYPPFYNIQNRNPNQAWIFTSSEPPEHYYNTDYKSPSWQNTMNWSCLYRLDSDIPNPYGYLIRSNKFQTLNYDSIYEKKKKNALWIVSHCHVASARRQYVLEMIRNGFNVDILGGCGNDGQKIDEDQLQQIIPSYRFFLAFENSLCIDYISEKYFNNYNYSWILVVRGGANYNQLLPKDTFINTADFKNIPMLVHYLLKLGNDRLRYTNYLKSKNKYVSGRWPGNKHCEICRRINNLNHFRKSYARLDTYLNENQCFRPKDLDKLPL